MQIDKKVYYVGFYTTKMYEFENRVTSLAAINKMDYICKALAEIGYNVEIISPSWTNNKIGFYKKHAITASEKKQVLLCPTFGSSNKLLKYISILTSMTWLLCFLLWNVNKCDKLLVYHSPWLYLPVYLAKLIKRFNIILEVEEVYQDVMQLKSILAMWENKLFEVADYYLFATDFLPRRVGNTEKKYIIIYGVYNLEPQVTTPYQDGKIHLVYAGIIDDEKKGAFNAVECARYLDDRYILHIIGFGSDDCISKLKCIIDEINHLNNCQVNYDGLKSGQEYIEFMQRCHIGLSTQTASGKYLESSFPSKILSYLSLGLRVISCDVECVRKSKIGNLVHYYELDTPLAISKAIKSVDISSEYNSFSEIHKLDSCFKAAINKLLCWR